MRIKKLCRNIRNFTVKYRWQKIPLLLFICLIMLRLRIPNVEDTHILSLPAKPGQLDLEKRRFY